MECSIASDHSRPREILVDYPYLDREDILWRFNTRPGAHYRWSSYRANAMGESTPLLTSHTLYATLGQDDAGRQAAYRELLDQVLPDKTIADIRLALNQTQPLGNSRFFDAIEQATGQRREAKPRGRPRKPAQDAAPGDNPQQLGLAGFAVL